MAAADDDTIAMPLVVRLAQAVRADVANGVYASGSLVASERALCRKYQASRTTVRNAIGRLVDEGILYRVPGSGTFVGSGRSRQQLDTVPRRTIALALLDLANPWFAELAESIQRAAKRQGWQLRLHLTHNDPDDEREFIQGLCHDRGIHGLLIVPVVGRIGLSREAPYRLLRAAAVPFVFVSNHLPDLAADYVIVDSQRGTYEATCYLIGLGHRTITYLGITPQGDDLASRWRHDGYVQAMREHGFEPCAAEVDQAAPSLTEAAAQAVGEHLRGKRRPTAVVAFNDLLAAVACRVVADAGLRVPDDVSVIGFDNTDLAAHGPVPLTSVDPSARRLGELAVDVLLDRLEHPDLTTYQKLVLRPNLIVRQSCVTPTVGPGETHACASPSHRPTRPIDP